MYPVRTKLVRTNAVFLAGLGQDTSGEDLVNKDPAVASLRIQLQTSEAEKQRTGAVNIYNLCEQKYQGRYARSGKKMISQVKSNCGMMPRTLTVKDLPSLSGWLVPQLSWWNDYKPLYDQYKSWVDRVENLKKELKKAEDSAWARLTKDLPYKSYIIKPRKSGSRIVYYVDEYQSGKRIGEAANIEEAKAIVDNLIAEAQSKEVEKLQEDRIIQEKEYEVQREKMRKDGTPPPEGKKVNKALVFGGLAAGAAFLFLR